MLATGPLLIVAEPGDGILSRDEALDTDVVLLRYQQRAWRRLLGEQSRPFGAYGWQPAANLYELDGGVLIRVEAAGLAPGDYQVAGRENRLIVTGERRVDAPQGAIRCHRVELPSGRFRVELVLPWACDVRRADIAYEAGILSIHVPRP